MKIKPNPNFAAAWMGNQVAQADEGVHVGLDSLNSNLDPLQAQTRLDKNLELEQQVQVAFDWRKDLADGATAALYAQNGPRLAFDAAFGLPKNLQDVYAAVQQKATSQLSGDELHQAVLKELTTLPEKRFGFEATPACFPKGTLVHTQNGLVPIEQIKVGDMVLSKHESGEGEQAYKPVTRVFEHGPTKVVQVWYVEGDEKPTFGGFVFTTQEHPFWIEGVGWTEARYLVGRPELARIPLHNSKFVHVQGVRHVVETSSPTVGWISQLGNIIDELGDEWNIEANTYHKQDVYVEEDYTYQDNPLRVPVWNLEVEDFHTYYVGKDGLWVHNKNPEDAIKVVNNGNPIDTLPSFFSAKELKRYLQDNHITQGFVITRAGEQSQYAFITETELKDWLKFEDGVRGRLIGPDGTRYEYAVVYQNPNPSPNPRAFDSSLPPFNTRPTGPAAAARLMV